MAAGFAASAARLERGAAAADDPRLSVTPSLRYTCGTISGIAGLTDPQAAIEAHRATTFAAFDAAVSDERLTPHERDRLVAWYHSHCTDDWFLVRATRAREITEELRALRVKSTAVHKAYQEMAKRLKEPKRKLETVNESLLRGYWSGTLHNNHAYHPYPLVTESRLKTIAPEKFGDIVRRDRVAAWTKKAKEEGRSVATVRRSANSATADAVSNIKAYQAALGPVTELAAQLDLMKRRAADLEAEQEALLTPASTFQQWYDWFMSLVFFWRSQKAPRRRPSVRRP